MISQVVRLVIYTVVASDCWCFLLVFIASSSLEFPSSEIHGYMCQRDPNKLMGCLMD
jgi:hypothetical protein